MKYSIWTLLVPTMLITANCQKAQDQPKEQLTDDQAAELQFMYEEEKMARDLYRAAEDTYDHHTFSHIQSSESTHMTKVGELLDYYGLGNPAEGLEEGIFSIAAIQSLYDSLNEASTTSLADALRMGALVEEKDILDLRKVSAKFSAQENVLLVLTSLEEASGNHLRAFVRQLSYEGITYEPVLMDQADFDAIMNAPHGHNGG